MLSGMLRKDKAMPRGDKSKYTNKQERKADHIAEGYEERGVPEQEAERRAWATVNKQDGGGQRAGGSGHDQPASRKKAARKDSAKHAAATRKRHAEQRAHR